jgi:hypothetical protein
MTSKPTTAALHDGYSDHLYDDTDPCYLARTLRKRDAALAAEKAKVALYEPIVKWAATMGWCSQTGHEHLWDAAKKADGQ